MKYAITGHTQGIGKHLFDKLSPDAVGFSKSTGYNIGNRVDRDKILTESADCDVFINNATDGIGQTHLLIEWFNKFHNTNKVIINVGSRIAEFDMAVERYDLLSYQAEKSILKTTSLRLSNIESCDVRYRWFAYVGTDKILKKYPHFTTSDYITLDEACDIILS